MFLCLLELPAWQTATSKPLKDALNQVLGSLNQGRSLYVSMSQYPDVFSPFFVSLIKVGEGTGKLDEMFLHLAGYLELEIDTVKNSKPFYVIRLRFSLRL